MITDPWFYAAAVPAMLILGLAKGGFGVIGILTVPILSIAISPVQAAGITLPILILSDLVAVYSYWREWDKGVLSVMLPGALLGIGIGWLTAAWVSESQIRLIVGVVAVVFALNYWFRHRTSTEAAKPNVAKGVFWGAVTGFVSFVSHAGGPPYQVYAAPLKLQPRLFAGTAVIFFATVNTIKLLPYFFLGQFDRENLITSAILLPISIPATLFGVWLVRRINLRTYYQAIYVLVFIVGLFLIGQSIYGML
ncbi:MAG: sulfite exporter TauE/SafE family protein [Bauldia sp.]|nr:sulfite exporter TauE/SafE family protein [Bauldia sp.]